MYDSKDFYLLVKNYDCFKKDSSDCFLELFGNVPIITYLSCFLGAKCVCIDKDFTNEIDRIIQYSNDYINALTERERAQLRQNFENPPLCERILSSFRIKKINPNSPFLVPQFHWFKGLILKKPIFLSYDLTNPIALNKIQNYKFNKIYIDPPLNIKYILKGGEEEFNKLITNSVEIIHDMTEECKSFGVIRIPSESRVPHKIRDLIFSKIHKFNLNIKDTRLNNHFIIY